MRRFAFGLSLLSCLGSGGLAEASFDFSTLSTASQTITFGPASGPSLNGFSQTLTAAGPQHFVVDPTGGTASVTSAFQGTDLLGQFSYNLYNTTTAGTVVSDNHGGFLITFSLQFELDVTSGPEAGLQLVTHSPSIFQADVSAIPFAPGTVFGDPGRPADPTNIYVKGDPSNIPFATSTNRTVTVNSVVPEPSSLALGLLGLGIAAVAARRRSA